VKIYSSGPIISILEKEVEFNSILSQQIKLDDITINRIL